MMLSGVLLGLLLLPAQAPEAETLMGEASQALAETRESEAYVLYQRILDLEPANLQALVGASWLAGKLSTYSPPGPERRDYTRRALSLAEQAYGLAPDHPEVNLVMAWANGGMALISGMSERVRRGLEMKPFLDRAVAGQPDDPRTWYLLGQWSRRIASASTLERAGARLIGVEVPDNVTLEDARGALARAVDMDPDSILYRWEYAQVLLDMDRTSEAVAQLEEAVGLEAQTPQDPGLLARLRYELEKRQ